MTTTVARTQRSAGRPLSRQVMRHRVRDSIERMIVEGGRRPGQRLVQHDLAQSLGVSRGVVREALMELKAGGLVQTEDNRGAVVVPIDGARLVEAFEMREMMEGLAARRCCTRITVPQLRELRGLVERMHKLFRARQWKRGGELDRQFHLHLFEIAGSRMLSDLSIGCIAISKFVTAGGVDAAQVQQIHKALLDAIADGNEDRAERMAREHVRSNRENVERLLATGGGELHWLVPGLRGPGR